MFSFCIVILFQNPEMFTSDSFLFATIPFEFKALWSCERSCRIEADKDGEESELVSSSFIVSAKGDRLGSVCPPS